MATQGRHTVIHTLVVAVVLTTRVFVVLRFYVLHQKNRFAVLQPGSCWTAIFCWQTAVPNITSMVCAKGKGMDCLRLWEASGGV